MDHLREYGHWAGGKYIEFRGGSDFFDGAPNCAEHFVHILDLHGTKEGLFKSFRASTRNKI